MKEWFHALVLPVVIQVTAIIYFTYHGGILETVTDIALCTVVSPFFWGLFVLIPTTIAQILCARALARADCRDYERFLIGVLNPSIAISAILMVGLVGYYRHL